MVYRGRVRNGVVVLDDLCHLPEGAEVQVNFLPVQKAEPSDQGIPSLYDQLRPFIGAAHGLPPDLSINHDHYLYGAPKRQ